ncbi:MAG TPA: DUF481 domain-containing protein [Bryobacteraceae bacterium]|jgi:hypothetical protein|nr:DUF481 domain-containing protein [Bryobacteraceae bacterium]
MNLKLLFRIFATLLLFSSASAVLLADQVTLKNGDVITGQIEKKDGANLIIKTQLMGEVTVAWSSVTNIKSDNPLFVKLPNGQQVNGKVTTEGGNLEVATPSNTATAPIGQVDTIRDAAEEQKYEKFLAPGWLDLWAGYVDLGFALARGNSHTDTLNTAFNASRATNDDKITLFMNQIYSTGTVGGVTGPTADSVRGGISYDHNINDRWFWNVSNTDEYDTFQNLNFRFVVGGGLGYHAIKNARTTLDLLAGFDYNHESFQLIPTGTLTRNLLEFNLGDDFTHKVTGVTSVNQSVRFYVSPNNGQYRVLFNAGAATVIHKWLSWQLSVSDSYLSAPIFGRKSNDIFITTGLRATFSR